jgi:hypothetical protein
MSLFRLHYVFNVTSTWKPNRIKYNGNSKLPSHIIPSIISSTFILILSSNLCLGLGVEIFFSVINYLFECSQVLTRVAKDDIGCDIMIRIRSVAVLLEM